MSPPKLLLAWYAVAGLAAFIAFAIDKSRAIHKRRRVPEKALHLFEFLGGWAGACLAILILHHKNRKLSFLARTGVISLLHILLWLAVAGVLWAPGSH